MKVVGDDRVSNPNLDFRPLLTVVNNSVAPRCAYWGPVAIPSPVAGSAPFRDRAHLLILYLVGQRQLMVPSDSRFSIDLPEKLPIMEREMK